MTGHIRSSVRLTQYVMLGIVTFAGAAMNGAAQGLPHPLPPAIGAAQVAAPWSSESIQERKSPGTAALISLLITGGGQIYNEETTKGIVMLALGIGFAAMAIDGADEYDCDPEEDCWEWLLPAGIGGALVVKTWSIIDAAAGARRWNQRHGVSSLSLRPSIALSPYRNRTVRVGLLHGTF